MDQLLIDEIAAEAFAVLGTGRQIATFSSRYPDFFLEDAYKAAARLHDLRTQRGEVAIGRKVGFTNREVWKNYGISGPIWGRLYDTTVRELAVMGDGFSLNGLAEPRIEPEIVLRLAKTPRSQMNDDELLACVDSVAHGFEIVHSIFAGWTFTGADAVAGHGVHAALLLGKRHAISGDRTRWAEALSNFSVELVQQNGTRRKGHGRDVLGGPMKALRFLVQELDREPSAQPLAPGEYVATGTLTEAMPAIAGETWTTMLSGIDIEGIRVRFR